MNQNSNKIVLSLFLVTLSVSSAFSTSLRDSVRKVINTNPNVIAERKNQEAYKKYVDQREGNYLPTVDIEAYYQDGKERRNRDSVENDGRWNTQNGYNAAIIFRQYIYDGGLTPAQVAETKHQELANSHRSFYAIENTVLETVKAYNSLVQSDELQALTKSMIKTNEDNLLIAKEQEEISGETLETYQVSSKLHFVKDRFLEEDSNKEANLTSYYKLVGENIEGKTCRPALDETKMPSSLDETIKKAILSNHRILEQIEKIRVQREKIAQANATFLPSLNLELKASIDEDLELSEDGREDEKYARLNLSWNLFNGNKDRNTSIQEKLFLQEQKKTLDDITAEVVAEVSTLYKNHYNLKKRMEEFKKYVESNVNIAQVYREEFQAGTRTFVDILNAESELYESTKNLIEIEFSYINNYYDLMFNLSNLTDSILYSNNQDCENVAPRIIEYKPKKKENNLESELDGLISTNDSDLIRKELGLQKIKEPQNDKKTKLKQKTSNFDKNINYKSFLDAPKNSYTINMGTFNDMNEANNFISKNNLNDKAYSFKFGKLKSKVKVVYGVYDSIRQANNNLENLSSNVLINKPYIDNINKHQKLYTKYN